MKLTLPILRCLVPTPYIGGGGGGVRQHPCDLNIPNPERLEICGLLGVLSKLAEVK